MRLVNKSNFIMFEKRLELLHKLKEESFYVRMHAYEYIVGTGDKIIVIVLLEPNRNVVEVLRLERANNNDVKRIVATIKNLDPNVKVNVRFFGARLNSPNLNIYSNVKVK